MRVFQNKSFQRFARKSGIAEKDLCQAAFEAAAGNFDADLGGGVYKQRVARKGGGASGGFRTILLLKEGTHVFLVYGFSKSSRPNITSKELKGFRHLSDILVALTDPQLDIAVKARELIEVFCNGESQEKAS